MCASIRSELEADGLALNELLAAANTTTAAEVARRASIRRASSQGISDMSVDYVRNLVLPWMHKLKPVWGSITEAICRVSDHTRTVSGTPAITAVVGLGLLAAQDQGIPVAYTAGTFALFALGNPYGFFRSPNVPHSIIVVDFFDREVPIPLSDATSSAVRRRLTW